MSQDFTKIVHIGRGAYGEVFANIKFTNGRLSITGVEGPTRDGNCKGSCGQIDMHKWGLTAYAPGWSADLSDRFRAVWRDWHLNDMQAGSPAQTAFLKANPIKATDHYTAACEALRAAGLNPDPSHLVDGKPYRYGRAWLRVEVPEEVLQFLQSLPDTDITPAWV